MSSDRALDGFIDSVLPVLLVGGRSRRFGRDKLLEPIPSSSESGGGEAGVLVDRPLRALRAVFGARVVGVGGCDPRVAARLDRCIEDQHPGAGPGAGILAALRLHRGPVFVLAGDMPSVTAPTVRRIVEHAAEHAARSAAVLAATGEVQPCFGVYFPAAAAALERAIGPGRTRPLYETLRGLTVTSVVVDAREAANTNTGADLVEGARTTERDEPRTK